MKQSASRRCPLACASIVLVLVAACSGGGGGYSPSNNSPPPIVTQPTPGISLLAGSIGGEGSIAERLNQPNGIALSSAGAGYVADSDSHTIRRISPNGMSTIAGLSGSSGAADGVGSAARFNRPTGVAVDASGNIFVSDTGNHTIRKITASGMVSTLAGAPLQPGAADGAGASARFRSPMGISIDAAGYLYVADSENHTVRRISPEGIVTTVAGEAGTCRYVDGIGLSARFCNPMGVAVGANGIVYVADSYNSNIRRIGPGDAVSTLAGANFSGNADGSGTLARFAMPTAMTIDTSGNVLVVDAGNSQIRKVTATGVVTTIPAEYHFQFGVPGGIAVDAAGTIYASETSKDTIRVVTQAGAVTTLIGQALDEYADGTGAAARFNLPVGIAVDSAGNAFVADTGNDVIRKVSPAGVVTTFAGKVGIYASVDGIGTTARFARPYGIAIGRDSALYVTDVGSHLIRKISADGVATTVTGQQWPSSSGSHLGPPGSLLLSVAVDGSNTVYALDTNYAIVRKVAVNGNITDLACVTGCPMGLSMYGIAIDAAGTVYVAEYSSISRISANGESTVIAGNRTEPGYADGTGAAARFNGCTALALDSAGNIFVADAVNHVIRKVTQAGVVTTVAGRAGVSGVVLGGLPGGLVRPQGIAINSEGVLLVVTGNAVVKIQP